MRNRRLTPFWRGWAQGSIVAFYAMALVEALWLTNELLRQHWPILGCLLLTLMCERYMRRVLDHDKESEHG